MGVRKKHHYIPRFYLKRFSINYGQKLIGLYNHKKKVFVQNAPLKHQACEEYLYGRDDDIEAALAALENEIAKMFYYWTEKKIFVPPPQNTPGFALLKRYLLYQLFRTPKAGNDVNMLMDKALKAYMQVYNPEKSSEYDGGKFVYENPTLLALANSADKVHLLNFLDCRFIVNLSDLSFITSDAPVITYNQLMENVGLYTGATAIVTKGIQIFYPIHPRLMICLYDPNIYQCGVNSKNCVSTESINDVDQLNILQYLTSNSQLFFNETISREYCESIVEQYSKIKGKESPVDQLTKAENNRHFYFTSYEDACIGLNLSFFKMLINPRDVSPEIAPLRHPSLERK